MTDLLAARLTMAISLGFHIILAAIGMVMPFLMAAAHHRWLRTGRSHYYQLTKVWMRGTAIFFATGAVSGTALSFELGVLWPGFMLHAGPIIGMPFSLEGAAFFIEAIALGLYLYGWGRMPPKIHFVTGVIVGLAGISSGILVVSANGWMNSPTGFLWQDGQAIDVDPIAALFNPAWFSQALHMTIASVETVGFAVAGVHAYLLMKFPDDPIHRPALKIALAFGCVAAMLQPLSGHFSAQDVAERQPAKLAAMEAHFETSTYAPLRIGGWPDVENQSVSFDIEVPGALSFLAFNDPAAEVLGLDAFPKDEWPPVPIVHVAFQIMVGIGTWLLLLAAIAALRLRNLDALLDRRWYLRCLVLSTPLGFVAIEAGWVVTEVGRQPWIIYEIMRTSEALTPVPGQVIHLVAFTLLYSLIGVSAFWMWRRQVLAAVDLPLPTPELESWRTDG